MILEALPGPKSLGEEKMVKQSVIKEDKVSCKTFNILKIWETHARNIWVKVGFII
jgi:hypothetical protein